MQLFPHPWCYSYNLIKIGQLASEIFKFESVDDGRRRTTTDDGPLVYYKLTLWAFGKDELKKIIIFPKWYVRGCFVKRFTLMRFQFISVSTCLTIVFRLFFDRSNRLHLRIESWFWSFNDGMNEKTDAHIVWRSFNEGMNEITDAHIVWRAFNEGIKWNNRRAHFCMSGYARHTMCASVVSFIPSLNDQNQLSILIINFRI